MSSQDWPPQPPRNQPEDHVQTQRMAQQSQWPDQPPAGAEPGRRAFTAPRRRRRWPLVTGIVVVIVVGLLVIGDRVAAAVTENVMASNFQSSLNLSGKPGVSIDGFPFLTQLAKRDFNNVNVNGSNLTDGQLDLASIHVTAHGMHINSNFSGATVDQVNGNAVVTFSSVANQLNVPVGLTLSPDGANKVKLTANAGPVSASGLAKVSRVGSDQIGVQIVDAGGIPLSVFGGRTSFTITVPKLPAGVQVQNVSVTAQGVMVSFSGQDVTFSK